MRNMTIGKKIALGFGVLILIAGLLGGMAVYNMKSVQTQAQMLATQFVPQTQIAGEVQDSVYTTMLAVRGYRLTTDKSYLEAARKEFANTETHLQDARKLAEANPDLVKLHEDIKELEPLLQSYKGLVDELETKNNDLVTTRERMNQTGADFASHAAELIKTQTGMLEDEIKTNADPAKLQERVTKLSLSTGIRLDANTARIAAFKSQVMRDLKLIEDGLTNFTMMDAKFAELAPLMRQPANIAELDRLKSDSQIYRTAMKEIMAASIAVNETGAKLVATSEALNKLCNETQLTGMKRTVEAANTSTDKLHAASLKMIVGLIGALLVGIAVAFFIIRNFNRVLTAVANTLNEGSDQVVSASGQVSSASQTLAEGASEQASSLEQTSSSLEEMSSMTKRNSENTQKANELAKEARTAADKGVGDMQTMAAAMEAIKVSSDDIAKIIKTIDEIAFQTNILALNAAVEAARAGEAGMGFAVVADEVRNLAQRCAQAAKETSGKIEGAIVKTGQGVEITSKVAAALNEIVTKVREVDELVTEVAGASREQTDGIVQINQAVGQMDKVTQSNAATAEESAAAAEELNSQAEVMKQSVAELLQLVGGKGGGAKAQPVAHARRTPAHTAKAVATQSTPTKGRNGNGHATPAMTTGKRRSEIPLEGDFKDF